MTEQSIWTLLTASGPLAVVLGYGLWWVANQWTMCLTRERALTEEYRKALLEQKDKYEAELRQVNERLFNQISNSTIAISTSSQNAEANKLAIGVITNHILNSRRRSAEADGDH